MLLLGSSLSLARPPNKKIFFPTKVKECPSRGQGGMLLAGAFGCKCFHSHLLACNSYNYKSNHSWSNKKRKRLAANKKG